MEDHELDFLLETTDIGKTHLFSWRFVPEFRQKVLDAKREGGVDNKKLLAIMQEVYDMKQQGLIGKNMNEGLCERGMDRIAHFVKAGRDKRLNVLYSQIPTSRRNIGRWLEVEKFRQEILSLLSNGVWISNEIVLRIMRVVYDDAENNPDQYPDFQFYHCGQAILDLEHALGLQTEDWKYDQNAKIFGSDFKPKRRE